MPPSACGAKKAGAGVRAKACGAKTARGARAEAHGVRASAYGQAADPGPPPPRGARHPVGACIWAGATCATSSWRHQLRTNGATCATFQPCDRRGGNSKGGRPFEMERAAPARAVNGVEVGRCCELPNETMKRQEPCGAKTAGVGMRTHPKARAMNSGRWQPAFTPNDLRFKPRDLHPITGQHAACRRPTLRMPTSRAAHRKPH